MKHREFAVYHWADNGEVKVDNYKDVWSAIDANGWLVITMTGERGIIRYPESSVVKTRETT